MAFSDHLLYSYTFKSNTRGNTQGSKARQTLHMAQTQLCHVAFIDIRLFYCADLCFCIAAAAATTA